MAYRYNQEEDEQAHPPAQPFAEWFKGSALVDQKGQPLLLWRGEQSGSDHRVFDRKKTRERGFFFTPVKEVADGYASRSTKARAFYCSAPKVLDLTQDTIANAKFVQEWGKSFDDWTDRASGEAVDPFDVVQAGQLFDYEGDWSSERWRDLQGTANSRGYDAVILPDWSNGIGTFPSVVVFDNKHIGLAADMPDSPYMLQQEKDREIEKAREAARSMASPEFEAR
jgi:hypothetical protein